MDLKGTRGEDNLSIVKENIKIYNEQLEVILNKMANNRHENVEIMIEDLFFRGLGIQIHQEVPDEKIENGEYILVDGYGYLSEDVMESIKDLEV